MGYSNWKEVIDTNQKKYDRGTQWTAEGKCTEGGNDIAKIKNDCGLGGGAHTYLAKGGGLLLPNCVREG